MKQHSKAVMIEADEAMAGYTLELLHAQVEPFGRPCVRGSRSMVVEDLWPPGLERVAE
jgi:hypothetical protein